MYHPSGPSTTPVWVTPTFSSHESHFERTSRDATASTTKENPASAIARDGSRCKPRLGRSGAESTAPTTWFSSSSTSKTESPNTSEYQSVLAVTSLTGILTCRIPRCGGGGILMPSATSVGVSGGV